MTKTTSWNVFAQFWVQGVICQGTPCLGPAWNISHRSSTQKIGRSGSSRLGLKGASTTIAIEVPDHCFYY